jgi:predicted nucleic acid-binding protein
LRIRLIREEEKRGEKEREKAAQDVHSPACNVHRVAARLAHAVHREALHVWQMMNISAALEIVVLCRVGWAQA